jgi:hypothetical protein
MSKVVVIVNVWYEKKDWLIAKNLVSIILLRWWTYIFTYVDVVNTIIV